MKKNKIVKITSLLLVVSLVATTFAMPFRAYAEFAEDGIGLDIDVSTIHLEDALGQIQNAAIIHLISQKIKKCIDDGHVVSTEKKSYRGRNKGVLGDEGAVAQGNIWNNWTTGRDGLTSVAVGPWLSSIFNDDDGNIECNNSKLFNMFVYIYKNYKAGITANDLTNASVTEEDRLKIICDRKDPTQPGLLAPVSYPGFKLADEDCSTAGHYTSDLSISEQSNYVGDIFKEMRDNSGNKYLKQLQWDTLEYYDKVDGYYLYSLDFKKQCGGASFSPTKGNDSDHTYIQGYEIEEDGNVKSGYYSFKSASSDPKDSFVNQPKTCAELIKGMNDSIKVYVKNVNKEIYDVCQAGVDAAIDDKKKELQEKYLSSENDKKADAEAVVAEYDRIQAENEYVEKTKDDGTKELVSVGTRFIQHDRHVNEWEDPYSSWGEPDYITEEVFDEGAIPTDYIWACRSHLPYIDVVVDQEADLAGALEDEFKDKCMEALDLGWLICPVINYISDAVDGLMDAVDGLI